MTIITRIYDRLQQLSDYRPSSTVNSLFDELYTYVIHNNDISSLTLGQKKQIQSICSSAEFELEKYRSARISDAHDPYAVLEQFPYYKNYYELATLEYYHYRALSGSVSSGNKVLFVGGGPLPLTGIMLARHHGICVTIIDNNEEACMLAQACIQALGLTDSIQFLYGDAASFITDEEYEYVQIASLCFRCDDHDTILRHTQQYKTKKYCMRTSHGVRTLLYQPIDEEVLRRYFSIETILHPYNYMVNSLIFAVEKKHLP